MPSPHPTPSSPVQGEGQQDNLMAKECPTADLTLPSEQRALRDGPAWARKRLADVDKFEDTALRGQDPRGAPRVCTRVKGSKDGIVEKLVAVRQRLYEVVLTCPPPPTHKWARPLQSLCRFRD
ncbi:unnamed protein product [Rangifer tarandus platyrhynchus]|uniref:Uncharacterized protein n=1 Tax=Rangifer tarandus platyrhynchus TaxID=3082113 RepID=A0AC59YJC9_RANTA